MIANYPCGVYSCYTLSTLFLIKAWRYLIIKYCKIDTCAILYLLQDDKKVWAVCYWNVAHYNEQPTLLLNRGHNFLCFDTDNGKGLVTDSQVVDMRTCQENDNCVLLDTVRCTNLFTLWQCAIALSTAEVFPCWE